MGHQLDRLEAINKQLEITFTSSRQEMLHLGIIEESHEQVYRIGTSNRQKLPFKRLYLPFAHTGILEPLKPVNETHKAIQILLPGAGTTFSIAETLCDIAGTFHGRKSKNRGKGRKSSQSILNQVLPDNKNFKVASFPADLPLNGMGTEAPFEFANERGLVAMIRHIHLVLSLLYPNRPVFVGGRSQGGMASILYGQHYGDVAGAFAINPPHPDKELFQFTVDYLEERAEILAELLHVPSISVHERSWAAYKAFTPNFKYPSRKPLAPTLIFVSLGDTFNLFPRYAHKMEELPRMSAKYQVELFDAAHNLWNRKQEDIYRKVVSLHIQFIMKHIQVSPLKSIRARPALVAV